MTRRGADWLWLQEEEKPAAAPSPAKKVKREGGTTTSQLDPVTRELVELIFSEDMFKSAMADMELDVKKMPLGALSKAQVQKGYDVLAELECAARRRLAACKSLACFYVLRAACCVLNWEPAVCGGVLRFEVCATFCMQRTRLKKPRRTVSPV